MQRMAESWARLKARCFVSEMAQRFAHLKDPPTAAVVKLEGLAIVEARWALLLG